MPAWEVGGLLGSPIVLLMTQQTHPSRQPWGRDLPTPGHRPQLRTQLTESVLGNELSPSPLYLPIQGELEKIPLCVAWGSITELSGF